MKHISLSYKIFTCFAYAFIAAIMLITLMVFMHIIAIALSAAGPAGANIVGLVPIDFTTESIRQAIGYPMIHRTFFNSLGRLFLGVAFNIVMMISVAYPLSKDNSRFPMRNFYAMIVLITMLFSGGLVPLYLWIKQLNLLDTVWSLVLPNGVPVFLCIVLMNFFKQIPADIEDAAYIDGASHFTTMVMIDIPLAKPAFATVTLFAIINHWNSWFDGLIYMKSPSLYPYATYLRMLIERMDRIQSIEDIENLINIGQRPLMMAYVIIGIIPIAVVYPFLQKHVKSGLMLGGVKG